ncbi:Holliday junction resolvase [Virgibacillus pantothenticus]|uniref:Holliday junction resolvase n=1 Tax=Virgibacillus pantothenticus TaxID=1473 RepID=A0A0L0QUW0_VIRPA|nr:Holliday junction resolvase [Virgibacillus pantothenticus]KNE22465.1 Holliday junction resolvase [Virgibacillus pantothenticus]MED3738082.1 Holliday junction resolvase [Virgibacillus pantothenticus]SIT17085.1 hypothetical protein SAMN05421787_12821 [Virgibacillus pantothenticus]
MIKLTIPGDMPDFNNIIKVSKSHPMAYANLKKQYTDLTMLYARNLPFIDKANLNFIWYCKNKRKDKDNIMTGQKFIIDGLVKAGVLKNDGWAQIGDLNHSFEVDKYNPRIEVILEEIA